MTYPTQTELALLEARIVEGTWQARKIEEFHDWLCTQNGIPAEVIAKSAEVLDEAWGRVNEMEHRFHCSQ